jgi:putative endonuclease
MKTKAIGMIAEAAAKDYLLTNHLVFIGKNYHCRQGEIDLIMKEDKQLVFVEVRYRKNKQYGTGIESITKEKQRRIITAARHYLHAHKLTETVSCRFDIVGVEPAQKSQKNTNVCEEFVFYWLKHAFY